MSILIFKTKKQFESLLYSDIIIFWEHWDMCFESPEKCVLRALRYVLWEPWDMCFESPEKCVLRALRNVFWDPWYMCLKSPEICALRVLRYVFWDPWYMCLERPEILCALRNKEKDKVKKRKTRNDPSNDPQSSRNHSECSCKDLRWEWERPIEREKECEIKKRQTNRDSVDKLGEM